ncbi:MAG: ABC transporter permease [Spirochaetaceae bacterium]|nr:MAG: ABC transporter permease [Spirochaetaceae bacterium]
MIKYTLQRLVALALTLLVILTIAFLVIRLMPGSIYENTELPPRLLETMEAKYRLNEPMIVQYAYFIRDILGGDWGTSIAIRVNVPVWQVLYARIPVSLQLNIVALAIALPVGVLAGIAAALFQNGKVDHAISFLVVVFVSVPSFVFATLLQYTLGFRLGLFPIVYRASAEGFARYASIVMPIAALSLGPIARVARYLRGELIETVSSDFMLLARTKGLSLFDATLRHAMRNSLLPLANIIIPMFTSILTGSLVVERIFAVAGVGGLLVNSLNASDHPLTIAILVFYSMLSLLTILIVDLSYGLIDPRVRVGGAKNE